MNIAVIKTGGKQYLVKEGTVLNVEKLLGAKKGDTVEFEVLFTDDGAKSGFDNQKLSGEVIDEGRADKKIVVKYKAKSRYFKKRGHRQPYSRIKIGKV
jgi:large subunit ribosomal protein L21